MRLRDNQRVRVYRAERVLHGQEKLDWQETQEWVAEITRTAWWRNRGGRAVLVSDGRGRRKPCSFGGEISIPRSARMRVVILHELAHELTWTRRPVASHGPEFVGNLLALVGRFMGPEATKQLRGSYRKNRVRHSRANQPNPRNIASLRA